MQVEPETETKTVLFELEVLEKDEGSRCYRCRTPYRPMFVLRPPHSTVGRYACIAHVGVVAEERDLNA